MTFYGRLKLCFSFNRKDMRISNHYVSYQLHIIYNYNWIIKPNKNYYLIINLKFINKIEVNIYIKIYILAWQHTLS